MLKRVLVVLLSASSLGLVGCLGEAGYESRLNRTLENLKFQRQLDANLNPAEAGRLKELNVFLRPPKGMAKAPAAGINVPANAYDAAETFLGVVDAAGNPIQLHVLVRAKPTKKPAPKPGDPPPPPETNLATFEADLRGLLNAVYGTGGETQSNPVTERGRAYKRILFSAADGQYVSTYIYEQPTEKVALIFVYPTASAGSQAVSKAIPLALGAMATGGKAVAAFNGNADGEGAAGGEAGLGF